MPVYMGQSFHHRLRCKSHDGTPADMTGLPLLMHIRESPESNQILLALSTAGGGLIVNGDAIDVIMSEEDTTALRNGPLAFDVRHATTYRRIFGGRILVKQGVTRD